MFQGLVGDVPVVVDVYEIEYRVAGSIRRIQWRSPMVSKRVIFTFCQISDFLQQFYTFSKFSLIFKLPKSEKTSIGDFFQHRHV